MKRRYYHGEDNLMRACFGRDISSAEELEEDEVLRLLLAAVVADWFNNSDKEGTFLYLIGKGLGYSALSNVVEVMEKGLMKIMREDKQEAQKIVSMLVEMLGEKLYRLELLELKKVALQ